MKLVNLNYSELTKDASSNPWVLSGLALNDFNLIIGKNSAGKSRAIRVIVALSNIIALRAPIIDGTWYAEFVTTKNGKSVIVIYELSIENRKVVKEKVMVNNDLKLDRNGDTEVFSEKTGTFVKIEPPDDKLVLHIRRDKLEYEFFEYLVDWAMSVRGYEFSDVRPGDITVEKDVTSLVRLNTVPQIIEKLGPETIKQTVEEFNSLGYEIEGIEVNSLNIAPMDVKILEIKERGIKHLIKQLHLSQGMFRALALLITLNYLLKIKGVSTILIDDLCEGMDFDRATSYAKLIYEKMQTAKIQLIATSNDSFLMNVVDIKYWNVLKRENTVVNAYNYKNSKDVFEEFRSTSLNNFDFLASNYYAKLGSIPDEKN